MKRNSLRILLRNEEKEIIYAVMFVGNIRAHFNVEFVRC